MQRLLTTFIAAALLSCRPPSPKVTSDFSGWPVDINKLISSIQTSTGSKVEIQEEFNYMISPTAPSGFILFVHSQAEERREDVLGSAFSTISDSLKANNFKLLSTEATSDKTDFRFVYTGKLDHGSITLKGLTYKDGVQLIICLLPPDDTLNKAEQGSPQNDR